MPKWISVNDRLPEVGSIVLIRQCYSWERFEDASEVTIGRLTARPDHATPYWEWQYYRPDFKHRTFFDNGIVCPGNEYVTHWMPLPKPPEQTDGVTIPVSLEGATHGQD